MHAAKQKIWCKLLELFDTLLYRHDRGILVCGYGVYMCSHCLRVSCDFLYVPSGAGRGKSVLRLRGDCTKIVQSHAVELPCSLRSLQTVRRPCRFRAEAAWRLCGDRGATVPFFFCVRPPRVPVRGLCDATYDMSTGLRFFKFV